MYLLENTGEDMMKNILVIVVLSLLLIGCNSDEHTPPFESLKLEKTDITLTIGDMHTLDYHIYPEEYTLSDITIRIGDEQIIAVDEDTITALETGGTEVIFYYNDDALTTLQVTVEPVTYEVEFEDTNIETMSIKEGTNLPPRFTIPSRDGYDFLGWYYDQALTKPFDYHTDITEDISLYAHWVAQDTNYNLENDFKDSPYKPDHRKKHVIIEANPDAGFNFPYIIYLPSTANEESNLGYKRYLLLEGFNGTYTNTLNPDLDTLANDKKNFYGQVVQEELFIPRIMPIIPDIAFFDTSSFTVDNDTLKTIDPKNYLDYTESDYLQWDTLYAYGYLTSHLDDYIESLYPREHSSEDEAFEAFLFDLMPHTELENYKDLASQYLAMIDDAQSKLNSAGWNLEDNVFIHGFSASGFLANRFTTLYPEKIQALFAGAFYYPVLPTDTYDGHTLTYPLGISDYESLFDNPFDRDAYQAVPKLYYIGQGDTLDPLSGSTLYGYTPSQRDIVYDTFGEGGFFDRFDAIVSAYHQVGGNALYMVDTTADHEILNSGHQTLSQFFKINRNHRGYHDYSQFHPSITYIHPPHKETSED